MRYDGLSPYARAALAVWTAILLILFLWLVPSPVFWETAVRSADTRPAM